MTKALNWGPAPQIMPTLGGAASAPCKDGIKISLGDPVLPQMSYLVRAGNVKYKTYMEADMTN